MNGMRTIVFSLLSIIIMISCNDNKIRTYEYAVNNVTPDSIKAEANKIALAYCNNSLYTGKELKLAESVKVTLGSPEKKIVVSDFRRIQEIVTDLYSVPIEGLVTYDIRGCQVFIPKDKLDTTMYRLFINLRNEKLQNEKKTKVL